ncbi:MAG: sugar ABC transporter permease, partial [Spirochaetaceae bacterium]|nr:sugar ABC transporter permease [Spirochaetaceae bacterium]
MGLKTVEEISADSSFSFTSGKSKLGNKYDWLIFMGPAMILVAVFFIAPVIIVFIISFTDMSSLTGFSNWSWIGFDNWIKIFTHPQSGQHVGVTVIYVFFTLVFFNVGLALVLSILTTHIPKAAGFAFRALWLVPRITPVVVYIMMWRYLMADSPYGIFNEIFFRPLGFTTAEMVSAHPYIAIILVNGFIGASFGMIIFTSAIESISKDMMNASLVDGAN